MTRRRRTARWLLASCLALLLAWKLIAELIEPHLLLWLRPRSPYLEAVSVRDTTLRLYSDTRPHVGKIAGLQKGLVWMREGRALVEEGYGFGCPIVEFDGRTYLSRHAEVEVAAERPFTRLLKRYYIDTVDTPIQLLRRKYRSVPSLGTVIYEYDIHGDGVIDISVDLSGLDVAWSRAYLMNEQGARWFTRYYDSEGVRLETDQIGIWSSDMFIERGCFESRDRDLSFCVEPDPPAMVYYGRERYSQYNWRGIFYLSWSGVDIELTAPQSTYRYRIALEAR